MTSPLLCRLMSHLRGLVALVIVGFASSQFGCTSYPPGTYGPASLPPAPIYATITAPPNVFFVLDTSYGMKSAIYDAGFDPQTVYPDWSLNGLLWLKDYDLIQVYFPIQIWLGMSCAYPKTPAATDVHEQYRIGVQQTGTFTYIYKCLKLPDPVGDGTTYYSSNYLNYLFTTYGTANSYTWPLIPPSPSYSSPPIPNEYRLKVAQDSINIIVGDPLNSNVRFCLAELDVLGIETSVDFLNCAKLSTSDSSLGKFQTIVSDFEANELSPLGQAYYDVTRYFRDMNSFYYGTNWSNPLAGQYRCTQNYIVMVTDGLAAYDNYFPWLTTQEPLLYNADTAYTDSTQPGNRPKLPNYDGLSPLAASSDYPAGAPAFSDGFQTTCCYGENGYSIYLDDMALFGAELNISLSGNDAAGKPFNDSAFLPRNIKTVGIGLAHGIQAMDDAAKYGGSGLSMQVDSTTNIQENAKGRFWPVKQQLASGTSVTATTGALTTSTKVFQAAYNTVDWSGRLYSYSVATGTATSPCSGTAGTVCSTADWEAGAVNDAAFLSGSGGTPSNRKLYTWNGSSGVSLTYANLTTAQKAALDTNPHSLATDSLGTQRISWLQGDQTNELGGSGTQAFRKRTHLLGDIVGSTPFFVGTPSFNYSYNNYVKFRQTYYTRKQIVYAAANDGMLHAFDTSTGREQFAYVPGAAFGSSAVPLLSRVTGSAYYHRYINDGPIASNDAYSSSWSSDYGWRTVLVGTGGAGYRGVYALNVTNPASFGASNVMWEFTSADDSDLGYVLGQPAIVRMPNGRWAAIVTSGYINDNAAGQAALFILFLDHTGSTWTRTTSTTSGDYVKILIPNPSGSGLSATSPNGLATPVVIDRDQDGYVDGVYFGDLAGDLWKVDVSSTTPSSWAVAYSGNPLFVAKDSAGTRQPITQRPNVGYNNNGSLANSNNNVMVYFGTGRLLNLDDINSTSVQSFYGVFDNNWATLPTNISRSTMLQQTLANSGTSRTVTSLAYTNVTTQYGFYMDFPTAGEFQIMDPVLLAGNLYFTTMYLNNSDPCATVFGGYLMVVSAKTGGGINNSQRFDTNNDGLINSTDSSASGIQLSSAPLTSPAIIDLGNGTSRLVGNTFNGDSYSILTSTIGLSGRQTWREFLP